MIEMVQGIDENERWINFLIKELPNISNTVIRYLKKMLNEENVVVGYQNYPEFNNLYKTGVKEWLQETNNFWKAVDRNYCSGELFF